MTYQIAFAAQTVGKPSNARPSKRRDIKPERAPEREQPEVAERKREELIREVLRAAELRVVSAHGVVLGIASRHDQEDPQTDQRKH